MQSAIQELQEVLLHEIPLTKHIGLRVISYEEGQLILKAPLAANINHKQTAFAGSLNALATLAGWGQVWLVLKELNLSGDIVIQDSNSNYLRPVNNDFAATCCKPDQAQIAKLAAVLKKKGKARLELHAEIYDAGTVAVTFTGRYVIFIKRETDIFAEEQNGITAW